MADLTTRVLDLKRRERIEAVVLGLVPSWPGQFPYILHSQAKDRLPDADINLVDVQLALVSLYGERKVYPKADVVGSIVRRVYRC